MASGASALSDMVGSGVWTWPGGTFLSPLADPCWFHGGALGLWLATSVCQAGSVEAEGLVTVRLVDAMVAVLGCRVTLVGGVASASGSRNCSRQMVGLPPGGFGRGLTHHRHRLGGCHFLNLVYGWIGRLCFSGDGLRW